MSEHIYFVLSMKTGVNHMAKQSYFKKEIMINLRQATMFLGFYTKL